MRKIPFPLLIAAALLLVPGSGSAQAPSAQPFEGKIEVEEALIDVLVTDRDGNVILGLQPSDFRVTEAGKPLEVTGATFYSNRRFLDAAGAKRLGIDPAAVPDERLYVLVIDDQSRLSASDPSFLLSRQLRAGRDLAEWLRDGLEPGDLVAVLSYDNRLRLQQEFTADRAELERAIDRAVRSAAEPKDWPSRTAERSDLPTLSAQLPSGDALRDRSASLEQALVTLADALAPMRGRKNLLLLTSGFGRLSPSGVPEARRFEPTIQSLNAANVAVYSVDLLPPGSDHPFSAVVSSLSRDTGGRPFFDLTDFKVPAEYLAKTTNGYYLVSFRSPDGARDGEYRPVEVSVANPEFRITARKGYRLSR